MQDPVSVAGAFRPAFQGRSRSVIVILLYPLAWILCHKAAALMDVMPGVSTWYPPAGLTLAFLLRFPSLWPLCYVGVGFVVAMDPYPSHPFAILLSWLISPSLYALGAVVLRRLGGSPFDLLRPRGAVLLIAAAIAIPALIGNLHVMVFCLDGIIPWSSYGMTVLRHMIGDGLGILSVAPLLLLWQQITAALRGRQGWILLVCTIAALAILQMEATGALLGFERNRLSYFVMLPIAASAALFGIAGAALSAFAANIAISTVALSNKDAAIAADSPYFMLSVACLSLVIGSLVEMRQQAVRRVSAQRNALDSAFRQAYGGEPAIALIHDIKQPLASIAAYAQGMRSLLRSGHSDHNAIAAAAERLEREAARLSNVVEQARQNGGSLNAPVATACFDDVLQELLGVLEQIASTHRVTMHADLRARGCRVASPPVAIQKMIVNLVENACEAMAGASDTRCSVVLQTRHEDGMLLLTISDTGPGFPPAMLGDGPTPFVSGKPDGSGIGLAIVREIVTAAGGRLEMRNRHVRHALGPGATVICRLPVLEHRDA